MGIRVGVKVGDGVGVLVSVADGRKVQVRLGVGVIVLVFVGVGLGADVKVNTAVILGMLGLGEGLRKKLIKTPKNNNMAKLNSVNKIIMRGERLEEGVAIVWIS